MLDSALITMAEFCGRYARKSCADSESFACEILDQVIKKLDKIYKQEYCRLVCSGSICHEVSVVRYSDNTDNYYSDNADKLKVRLEITSGVKLKSAAVEEFFQGYSNRRWQGVNAAFQLKMLRFPESMTIMKLRRYFNAMAELLRAKTVLESDMRDNPNPFSAIGGPVYDPEAICCRLGTGLVEAVQNFGLNLGENRCFRAVCELERILQLQAEICRITDQKVKELTKEALDVLKQNMDVLKVYFDIWDNYIEGIICGDQSVAAYIENISCAGSEADDAENPWLKDRDRNG